MTLDLPRRDFLAWSGTPLVAALVAAMARASGAQAPQTPPSGGAAPTAPRPQVNPGKAPADIRQRIITYLLIGGSDPDKGGRMIGTLTREGGWREYIDKYVKPSFAWGSRRYWLQWPFGITNLPNNTEWDQFLKAREARMSWLTGDFVDRWLAVRTGSLGAPVDLTAYIGSAFGEPGMMRLLEQDRAAQWLSRAVASVLPYLECRMNIGVDASVSTPEDQPDLPLCELLGALGTRIYVESRPMKQYPRWNRFNVVCDANFWYRSDPLTHNDSAWAVANADLKGEIVRGLFYPPKGANENDPSWMVREARKILREGHTVLLNTNFLVEKGISMTDLVKDI